MTPCQQLHPLIIAGLLALVGSYFFKYTLHISSGETIGSFLTGMSIALMLGGLVKSRRRAA